MYLSISGGKRLGGELCIQAAKNSILPIIACCIMTSETIVLKNCPPLLDVCSMLEIIKSMGGTACFDGDNIVINCRDITPAHIDSALTQGIRSSIFILGPILARFGQASVSFPGGCEIGKRPIDLHLDGLRALGVKIVGDERHVCDCSCGGKVHFSGDKSNLDVSGKNSGSNSDKLPCNSGCSCGEKVYDNPQNCGGNESCCDENRSGGGCCKCDGNGDRNSGGCKFGSNDIIICDGRGMQGGEINLKLPSVGATENIMMAAVLTRGTTVINNAAREPEIEDLARFINSLGGKVFGAGTSSVVVHGVDNLCGGEFTPIPDRIVAGTYLAACAMTGGKIRLVGVVKEHIDSIIDRLSAAGCNFSFKGDIVTASASRGLRAVKKTSTMPYPGFPTDMQAQLVAVLSVAKGESVVQENLFESRFRYAKQLLKMGADIKVERTSAVINGVSRLTGTRLAAQDLRGGAALVLAGLVAEGKTTVTDIHHIDRGYYKIENDLAALGADITRFGE